MQRGATGDADGFAIAASVQVPRAADLQGAASDTGGTGVRVGASERNRIGPSLKERGVGVCAADDATERNAAIGVTKIGGCVELDVAGDRTGASENALAILRAADTVSINHHVVAYGQAVEQERGIARRAITNSDRAGTQGCCIRRRHPALDKS